MDRNRENNDRKDSQNTNKFTTKMQKKLVVLYFLVLLAFAGLSARLVLINRDNGEQYKRQVLSQQQYSSRTLPFKRGEILDSKGTKLAVSEKVYNLVLDCKLMNEKEEYVEGTIAALTQCFDVSESDIRSYNEQNPTSQYHVLKRQLTYDEIAPFQELQNNEEQGKYIQGVWFEEEYRRVYPNNTMAADVVGFTSKDNVGNYGLEEYYNDILSGINGREYGYMNDDSNLERTTKAAVDGYNLVTTLDANIQGIVERKLQEYNDTYKNAAREGNGAQNVGCIIMDVNNGDILAMASYPFFNLNDPRNTDMLLGQHVVNEQGAVQDTIINEETLAGFDDDTLYRQLNALWKNYCISNTYEPGSTMKPFTVAAGLESGKLTGNETYQCNGSLTIVEGQKPIKCHSYRTGGDGLVTVEGAIERSCNVALMKMGQAIGKTTLLKYMQDFNFGLKTNIDLAGEARTASLVFTEDSMGPVELATASFGQGFNVTMIQMVAGFSSLINGGYYYEPHMVSKITASDGSVVRNIEPRLLKQTVSESTSAKIRDYCKAVVVGENGTGHTARPAGYIIGGKTGTAETQPRGNNQYVVSFIGYAPADDPRIAIYVVVDRPNSDKQDDAKYATRIVKSVLTEVLPYMDIFMTEPLSEAEQKELEEQQIAYKQQLMSQVSGNDVSDNDVGGEGGEDQEGGQAGEGSQSGENTGNEEDNVNRPAMEIDPETGYGILPDGTRVDPKTGDAIDEDTPLDLPEPNLPLNDGQNQGDEGGDNSPF